MRDLHTFRGLIVPADGDDGRVTLVSLLTDGEGEYRVLTDRAGRELIHYVRERVQASGHLFRDDQGEQVLQVEQFSVLRGEAGRRLP